MDIDSQALKLFSGLFMVGISIGVLYTTDLVVLAAGFMAIGAYVIFKK